MRISELLPRGIRRALRLPISRKRLMNELDDEIRFHLESCTDAFRRAGMSEDEAEAAALARFGDGEELRAHCARIANRRLRRSSVLDAWHTWTQDVRFAFRQLRRTPAFTATAVSMLALGVGANTAIFSVVHHLLVAPLPFPGGNRMVQFMMTSGGGRVFIMPSPDVIAEWRARTRSVDEITGLWDGEKVLGDTSSSRAERIKTAMIQPSALDFAGAHPLLGRPIVAADTLSGAAPVALVGYEFWHKRFAGSNRILGATIRLDGAPFTVVGVMPERFFIPFADEVHDVFTAMPAGTMGKPVSVIGKLRPGVTVEAANRELAAMFAPHTDANPYDDPPRLVREVDLTGRDTRRLVLVLFAAVSVVLLIACANVANLLLARAWSRQRELAVRAALGAGRGRLVRQMLTESVLLGLLGGALGIGVAYGTLRLVVAAQPPNRGMLDGVSIEHAVLWWAMGVSVLTGLLFGAAPALFAADKRLGQSLNSSARTTGSRLARRFRTGLVVVEVALSVVLLSGAGLLVRTIAALHHLDVGFNPRGLGGASLGVTDPRLNDPTALAAVLRGVRDRVRAIPGVTGVATATGVPPEFGIAMGALEIEGRPTDARDTVKVLGFNAVDTSFFRLVGLPVRRGRVFAPLAPNANTSAGGEVMVNETMARRFWPRGNAVGARLRRSATAPWSTVVGVVADVTFPSLATYGKDLQLYVPAAPASAMTGLVVRTTLSAPELDAAVRKAVHDVNPMIRVRVVRSAEDYIAHAADTQRFVLTLLGDFALLAVVLAAVGLYGVVAYAVTQRTREIGVRVALGAQASDVARLVVGNGVAIAACGVMLGVTGALLATRALQSWLYGVTPNDPMTLITVAAMLMGVAVVSTLAPARRAARLDPIDALRTD